MFWRRSSRTMEVLLCINLVSYQIARDPNAAYPLLSCRTWRAVETGTEWDRSVDAAGVLQRRGRDPNTAKSEADFRSGELAYIGRWRVEWRRGGNLRKEAR